MLMLRLWNIENNIKICKNPLHQRHPRSKNKINHSNQEIDHSTFINLSHLCTVNNYKEIF
jgi:hypothetical protein